MPRNEHDYDMYDSPGYYSDSFASRFYDRRFETFPRIKQLANPEETHSLHHTEAYVFHQNDVLLADMLHPQAVEDLGYRCIRIPENHLVRRLSQLSLGDKPLTENVFQVRIDGIDWGFTLSEDQLTQLERISPLRAAKLMLQQFLKDGR